MGVRGRDQGIMGSRMGGARPAEASFARGEPLTWLVEVFLDAKTEKTRP